MLPRESQRSGHHSEEIRSMEEKRERVKGSGDDVRREG